MSHYADIIVEMGTLERNIAKMVDKIQELENQNTTLRSRLDALRVEYVELGDFYVALKKKYESIKEIPNPSLGNVKELKENVAVLIAELDECIEVLSAE